MSELAVLSTRQPYASAIMAGVKKVENRTWRPPDRLIGDRMAIHASTNHSFVNDDLLMEDVRRLWPDMPDHYGMPYGCIIGTVRLVDCVRADARPEDMWATGPWCWVLADPQPCEPFACRGFPGIFTCSAWPLSGGRLTTHTPHGRA